MHAERTRAETRLSTTGRPPELVASFVGEPAPVRIQNGSAKHPTKFLMPAPRTMRW
jgi:hypothetical protein